MEGAVERVRPKMMTVVAIMAGLLPIMWSTGTGSEIMQRIAVPMIGGMISSTLLTLIVIPAIFGLVKGYRLPAVSTGSRRSVRRQRSAAAPKVVSGASIELRRCRLAIRRGELHRSFRIGRKGRGRCSAQRVLLRWSERDAFGLAIHVENGNALETPGIDRLVVMAHQEDFERLVFRDEFGMVWAGIDDTSAMPAFRAVRIGRQPGQQGNDENEIFQTSCAVSFEDMNVNRNAKQRDLRAAPRTSAASAASAAFGRTSETAPA